MKLDSCTWKQSASNMRRLASCYLFNLMRAIFLSDNATTVSDASTGIADESVDHVSALMSNGSSLLLSSCIFSYTYDMFDLVSIALFWSMMN